MESDQSMTAGDMNVDASSTPMAPGIRSPIDDLLSKSSQGPPSLIVVIGVTGSGKTTFVNQASGSHLKVGHDLDSCTSETQVSEEFVLDDRRVALIDTPGFDDTNLNDTEVLKSIAESLGKLYSAGVKLTGIIYVHRISDDRFEGSTAKHFQMFKKLCGGKALKNAALVTNMWGLVTPQEGVTREQQLKDRFFKSAIRKGAQLYRHDNTPESAQEILRRVLENGPVVLKIQQELVDEGKDVGNTGAGTVLNKEIREAVGKYRKEIKDVEKSMRKAVKEKDEQSERELREEKRRMQEELARLRGDSARMRLVQAWLRRISRFRLRFVRP